MKAKSIAQVKLNARMRESMPVRPKVRMPSGKLRGSPTRVSPDQVSPDSEMPARMDHAAQVASTRDGMSDWEKEKRKAAALGRMRRSGLFEMDLASWTRYFDENPDQITTGFVNFVISQRRTELRRWL